MARGSSWEFNIDPQGVAAAIQLFNELFEPRASRKARQTREALESIAQQKAWGWPKETQKEYLRSFMYDPGQLRRTFRPSERQVAPLFQKEVPIISTTGRPSKVYEPVEEIPRPPMFEKPSQEDIAGMKGFLSDIGIPEEEHSDILLSWQTSTKRPETFEKTANEAEKRANYVTKDPEEKNALMRFQLTGDKGHLQDIIPQDVQEADALVAQNREKFPGSTDYDIAKKVIKNPKQFRKWVIFNEPLIKMEEQISARRELTKEQLTAHKERERERKEKERERKEEKETVPPSSYNLIRSAVARMFYSDPKVWIDSRTGQQLPKPNLEDVHPNELADTIYTSMQEYQRNAFDKIVAAAERYVKQLGVQSAVQRAIKEYQPTYPETMRKRPPERTRERELRYRVPGKGVITIRPEEEESFIQFYPNAEKVR